MGIWCSEFVCHEPEWKFGWGHAQLGCGEGWSRRQNIVKCLVA